MLKEFAIHGVPTTVTPPFTLDALEHAVQRGAHPSARTPAAIKALREEAHEKVQKGHARLVKWQDLREALPQNIRISPLAAIPHKSRDFRMILDLSFAFRVDGTLWPSVNDSTDEAQCPLQAMGQLGSVLPRLVHAVATSNPEDGPWLFAKIDIKDGFWNLMVPEDQEFNFCYVMPKLSTEEDTYLVVPAALQMGWKLSPPYFGAATETGRDVAEALRQLRSLPPHPQEDTMMNSEDIAMLHKLKPPHLWRHPDQMNFHSTIQHLLEVYVDDYIGAIQSTNPKDLRHHSRALLHAIHSIFPAVDEGRAHPEDPISKKKMDKGDGVWAFRKELLGWIFDGLQRTIELPPEKVDKLHSTVTGVLRKQGCKVGEFQTLVGKLQHAALGIPAGRGLLQPLYAMLPSMDEQAWRGYKHKHLRIPKASPEATALQDFRTLFRIVGKRPTQCKELIPDWPDLVGFCDACRWGAGGVWISGKQGIHPVVWRVQWPADISNSLRTKENPHGTVTINDLEMAGILLGHLVLEQRVQSLKGLHNSMWCDNRSSVSWTSRLCSSKSTIGQRLVRALSLRFLATESSPLAPWSIAGRDNELGDIPSRSFNAAGGPGNRVLNDAQLLQLFDSKFPLTQNASWQMHHLPNKLSLLVFLELRQEPPPMGSWLRLTKLGSNFGTTGTASSENSLPAATPSLTTSTRTINWNLSKPMPIGCEWETQDEKIRLALNEFRKRWQPLPRPSNWLKNPVPHTKHKPSKFTGQH